MYLSETVTILSQSQQPNPYVRPTTPPSLNNSHFLTFHLLNVLSLSQVDLFAFVRSSKSSSSAPDSLISHFEVEMWTRLATNKKAAAIAETQNDASGEHCDKGHEVRAEVKEAPFPAAGPRAENHTLKQNTHPRVYNRTRRATLTECDLMMVSCTLGQNPRNGALLTSLVSRAFRRTR